MTSIRVRLLFRLLVLVVVAFVTAGGFLYFKVLHEANELFDYQLEQIAASIPGRLFIQFPGQSEVQDEVEGEDGVTLQIWRKEGSAINLAQEKEDIPRQTTPGLTTIQTPKGALRVFNASIKNYHVQVSQPIAVRRRMAAGMALRIALPLFAVVPIIGFFVWLIIGLGLRPLSRVRSALEARSHFALHPIQIENLPLEVIPLVDALNDLLGRLGNALENQRAFIADAAHELRTPLAALQLQVQLAEKTTDAAARDAAFADLKAGLKRSARLINQLLVLARQEHDLSNQPFAPIDLDQLAREVMSGLMPLADEKKIDIGFNRIERVVVQGDHDSLFVMISNLIDNAVRYTPPGGKVDISLYDSPAGTIFEIADSGPGISPADRERVFDRFYRPAGAAAPGSGLGLAIVRQIAESHSATVTLNDTPTGEGVNVRVSFPAKTRG